MEGTLTVSYRGVNATVLGCPKTAQVLMHEDNKTITIITSGGNREVCSANTHLGLFNWIRGSQKSMDLMFTFVNWFDFVPIYEYTNGKRCFVPEASFKSMEEMKNRKLPAVTQKFMGVEKFPVAFLKKMSTVVGIADDLDMLGFPETIDISGLDPEITAHFRDAMEALLPENRGTKPIKLEYLPIYEFLGLDIATSRERFVIHGSDLLNVTIANLAIAGVLADKKVTMHNLFPVSNEIDWKSQTGYEYLSDQIIIEYELCQRMFSLGIGSDFKLDSRQKRIFQFIAKQNGMTLQ